jgi:hypothetical protein
MNLKKSNAIKLRRLGRSYNEINKTLKISKSTLSDWFKNEEWSENIKNKILENTHKERTEKMRKAHKDFWQNKYLDYRHRAETEFSTFKNDFLFIAGIMLYWAEGDNGEKAIVRLTNTDPRMINLFGKFLLKFGNIDKNKIRLYLMLYNDLEEPSCKRFWTKNVGLPLTRFHKTQYIGGRHPTKRLAYGICNINICNRELKEKITSWISLWFKELTRDSYSGST